MSSSMLECRAREAARVAGHSLTIRAVSASEISTCDFALTPVELVLLAPQVRFKKMSVIERVAPFGIIVQEIAPLVSSQ
jgi:PTS system cellobiose-specific IIB component